MKITVQEELFNIVVKMIIGWSAYNDTLTWHATPREGIRAGAGDFDPETGQCTMQLVRSDVHTGVPGMAHSGSVAQWKKYYIDASNAPNNMFYQ